MSDILPDDQKDKKSLQKDQMLKQLLTSEARMRLGNVKLVKPELVNSVEEYLLNLSSQGRINSPINDTQLKQILLSLQQPKKEFKFNRG